MPKMATPGTLSRHLRRHRQVAEVLAKHGFGQVVDHLRLWESTNLRRYVPKWREGQEPHLLTLPERVRLALEELGPTYVKLGQMLSTRPDMIPPEIIAELEKLQCQVAPFSNELARQIVCEELGHPLDEVFTSFDEEPVAAASLSQVYRAVLKGGNVVAVKVQRPGIRELVQIDLEVMHDLATRLEHWQEAQEIGLVSLVDEFASDMKKELDFSSEANNLRRFAQSFKDASCVRVPKVYREFSTPRLLVMEFIEGVTVSKVDRLKAEGYSLRKIAHNGADIYLKSILEDGFFHADPHPGNILVLPDNVVCLLDFGMMGRLSSHDREILTGMVYSLVEYDAKAMSRLLLELTGSQTKASAEQLESEVSTLIDDYAYLPLDELNLGECLDQIVRLLRNHHLHLPKHYVWVFRVVSMVENIGRELDPHFNLAKYSKPYVQDLVTRSLAPSQLMHELRFTAKDSLKLAKDLPSEIRTILSQVRQGQIKMEVEPVGLEPFKVTLSHIFNRIVVALIVGAMVIGSSLIVRSGLPPLAWGVPAIGLAGFIIATLLGLWVVITVLRNGIS